MLSLVTYTHTVPEHITCPDISFSPLIHILTTAPLTEANVCVFGCMCLLCSNLKKCEESVNRVQAELEENERSMAELAEQLKKLEDEAGEIMKACQEAEVGTLSSLYV